MRKLSKLLALGLVYLASLVCIQQAVAAPTPLDGVVAIVNNDIITRSELNQAVAMAEKQLAASNTPAPPMQQLQLQVLNQLIDKKLELQTAERMGITVSEDQLNQAIQSIAAKNNMTVAQLHDAITNEGVNFAEYRKQLKEQLIMHQVLQEAVGSSIKITPQDIKNAESSPALTANNHAQYDIDDILIALPDEPSSADVQRAYSSAQSIMTQLKNGANFKTIAAANSSGDEALRGGDLGWRSLNDLPTVFAEKVISMKPGEIAGPIRTGNGLHIIKLEGVKDESAGHTITETHVRHILIKTNLASDDAPAKQEILSLRKQIENGADFATLAKKYSQDSGSAQKGGDIGWVTPGVLVPPFEQAMNGLAINQLSQPVKTTYGWHLIQVLGRKQVDDGKQYHDDQIKKIIFDRQFNENAQIWIQQMRHESYVKILL
jgi:peptidyl-prolyl cis-trans isomerase SurA